MNCYCINKRIVISTQISFQVKEFQIAGIDFPSRSLQHMWHFEAIY